MNNTDLKSLTPNDWQIVNKSKDLLKVFYDVTREISAEKYITISKQIIFVKAMLKYSQTFIDDISLPREVLDMANTLKEKFHDIEDNELIAQATLLDPRFKKHGFSNGDKCNKSIIQLRKKLQSIRQQINPLPQPSSFTPPQVLQYGKILIKL